MGRKPEPVGPREEVAEDTTRLKGNGKGQLLWCGCPLSSPEYQDLSISLLDKTSWGHPRDARVTRPRN